MADDGNDGSIEYRTSTFSGGGNCVRVGFTAGGEVTVQHSDDSGVPVAFTGDQWDAFVAGVKNDEFDRPTG